MISIYEKRSLGLLILRQGLLAGCCSLFDRYYVRLSY
jgi:hypothetical protein